MLNKSTLLVVLGSAMVGIAKSTSSGSRSVEPNINNGTFSPESMEQLIAVAKDPVLNPTIHRIHLDGWEMGQIEGLSDEDIENKVREIPDEIILFENLTSLHAEYLNISKLPNNLNKLSKLKKIVLESNRFTSIPQELSRMNLEKIDLSYNEISQLNTSDLLPICNERTKIILNNCGIERLSDDYVSALGDFIYNIDLSYNYPLINASDEYLISLLNSGFPIRLFLKYFRPLNIHVSRVKDYRYYYGDIRGEQGLSEGNFSNIFRTLEYSKDPVWLLTRVDDTFRLGFYRRKTDRVTLQEKQDLCDQLFACICQMINLERLNIDGSRREGMSRFGGYEYSKINANIPESISNLQKVRKVSIYGFNSINGLINLNGLNQDLRIQLYIDCNHVNFNELYGLSSIKELKLGMKDLVLPEGIDQMNLHRLTVPYIIYIPDSILKLRNFSLYLEENRNTSAWRPKKTLRIPDPRKIIEATKNGFPEQIALEMFRLASNVKPKSQLRRF